MCIVSVSKSYAEVFEKHLTGLDLLGLFTGYNLSLQCRTECMRDIRPWIIIFHFPKHWYQVTEIVALKAEHYGIATNHLPLFFCDCDAPRCSGRRVNQPVARTGNDLARSAGCCDRGIGRNQQFDDN